MEKTLHSPFLATLVYPALSKIQDNDRYLLFTVVKDIGFLPKQEDRLHPFLEVFKAWYYCTSKRNWLCSYSV